MSSTKEKALDTANIKGFKLKNFNNLNPDYRTSGDKLPLSTHEVLTNFRQFIAETLSHAPNLIKPTGKLERFSSSGKRGDLSGWYVLHLHHDYAAGAFGCWRTGINQTWHSGNGTTPLSDADRQAIRAAIAQAKQQHAQERAAKAHQARQQAIQLWETAQPASSTHPYLARKQVGAYGIRQHTANLLVPLCDLDGMLHSLQTITPAGEKRFLAGTPKRGLFFLLIDWSAYECGDALNNPHGVYVCEGYATGASLYEAYHLPVLVAFDAGNLLPVTQAYRSRYPFNPVTVCADNDRKNDLNTGLTKAREVVATVPNVGLIVPQFPAGAPLHLSDFNDLSVLLGSSTKEKTQ